MTGVDFRHVYEFDPNSYRVRGGRGIESACATRLTMFLICSNLRLVQLLR